MSLQRQSNLPEGRNVQVHQRTDSGIHMPHQRPKSSRRSLFKENMAPNLKPTIGGDAAVTRGRSHPFKKPSNAKRKLCPKSVHQRESDFTTGAPYEVGLRSVGIGDRADVRRSARSAYKENGDFDQGGWEHNERLAEHLVEHLVTVSDGEIRKRTMQDNIGYPRHLKPTSTTQDITAMKKPGTFQDNVVGKLKLMTSARCKAVLSDDRPTSTARLIDCLTVSKVQDNVAFDKSSSDIHNGVGVRSSWIVPPLQKDRSISRLHHRQHPTPMSVSDRNHYRKDQSRWNDNQRRRGSDCTEDDLVISPSLPEDPRRYLRSASDAPSKPCDGSVPETASVVWKEPAGTISGEEDENFSNRGFFADGDSKMVRVGIPPQWQEEWPQQPPIHDASINQSECSEDPNVAMETSELGSMHLSQLHNQGQIPSQNPQQYTASVHRVEEVIIQSPVPSFHRQLDQDHVLLNSSHLRNGQGVSLEHRGDHLSDGVYHRGKQGWSDVRSQGNHIWTGSGHNGSLDMYQSEYSSEDHERGRWYAPDSGRWVEAPGTFSRNLYHHPTDPENDLPENDHEACESKLLEINSQDYRLNSGHRMEPSRIPVPDKNHPTSRYIRESYVRDKNYNLPFNSSPRTTTSRQRLLYPASSRTDDTISDFSETENVDFRELDKLDDADLYRLSEADDFIHSKPLEGLYARSIPLGGKKNPTFSKESEESGTEGDEKKPDKEKKEDIDEDKDEDAFDLESKESHSENWNNNNMDTDRGSSALEHEGRSFSLSPSREGFKRQIINKSPRKDNLKAPASPKGSMNRNPFKARTNSGIVEGGLLPSPARPNNKKDASEPLDEDPDASSSLRGRTNRQMLSKVTLSPSAVSINTTVLETQLQYSLTSKTPLLRMTTQTISPVQDLLCQPGLDSSIPTKVSSLRHTYPARQSLPLTIQDLRLNTKHKSAENKTLSSDIGTRQTERKRSAYHEYSTVGSSAATSHLYRSRKAASGQQNQRKYTERQSNQKQNETTSAKHKQTKKMRDFSQVPKPVRSVGVPKKSQAAEAGKSTNPSTLSLSSSRSPRRAFSILWAFRILDILHSAPPDSHEQLVTKLYWFRRWHRNVRLIRIQQEQRTELLNRAVTHHRHQLLFKCLQAWRLALPCHQRAADMLRRTHLLQKGFNGLRWAVSRSRLEIEGTLTKLRQKTLRHHFSIWRDIYQVRTERAQLLEKLAVKHSTAKCFHTWKDLYGMIQKEGIARLHYKVSLLTRGFHNWKLFTSQSKVKGYRDEMSRVHREETTVKKAWCTMKEAYAQSQRAKKHFNQKVLCLVMRAWVRGSQLAKAERRHQHSQALELRRHGLVRAHFKQWQEELVIVQVRQRLDRVRMRYSWELWTLRLQRKQLYRHIMDSQARKVAKQRIFSRWRWVARRQKEVGIRAALILRQTYLRIVFDAWKRYVDREHNLRSTLSTLLEKSNLRVRLTTLHTWTGRLRTLEANRAAHRAWSLRCVHRAVAKWKDRVRHRRMEAKLVQFQPVHEKHVIGDAFKRWSSEFQLAQHDHKRAVSAQQFLLRNRLLRLLLSWRLLAKESKTIAPFLERRNWKQTANSFDAWREIVLRKKSCKKYQAACLFNAVNGAFVKWRDQADTEKKIRMVKKLLLVSKLTRALLGWKDAVHRQTSLRAYLKQRQEDLVLETFSTWKLTWETRSLEREVLEGDEARHVLLLTVFFKRWFENAQQQREAEHSLVSGQHDRSSLRQMKEAYESWRRQLLVQDIARDAQADRVSSFIHRIFNAWYKETRSTYADMTEKFQLACDFVGVSFAQDNVSPKSASSSVIAPDLPGSLSSSSGGSHGLHAHFSAADSGYCGNGLLPHLHLPVSSGDDHQEILQFQEDHLNEDTQSRSHQEEFLEGDDNRDPSSSQVSGFGRYRVDSERSKEGLASADEDVFPEEPPLHLGSPRLKGPQQRVKMYPQPPTSLKFDTQSSTHTSPESPVAAVKQMSFLRRRASLDVSLLGTPHSGMRSGGIRRPSMDQNLLASPAVLEHLRNIHRKSQTENPLLTSMEEEDQETDSDDHLFRRRSGVMNLNQHKTSWSMSPESHEHLPSTQRRGASFALNISPPSGSSSQLFPQSGVSGSFSSSTSTHPPRTASLTPNLSKSLSPSSPKSPSSHHLPERATPQDGGGYADSRRSSLSECSSVGPESTRSSSFYMQLSGYGHDRCQSTTLSEYAPSVFSETMAPVMFPQVDQKIYLRSLIQHWLLFPASAAFNQWLDYTRYRHDLRELSEQVHELFDQQRLRHALKAWQRQCSVERLARNHWEMRTKAVHLLVWLQHIQDSKRHAKQKALAEETSRNRHLIRAFSIWQTKFKKHKAVLTIVHNWKGCMKQTEHLEDRTKDLKKAIRRRSLRECFKSWKMQTWQILQVKAHYNRVVTHRCLEAWSDWSRENSLRQQKLQAFKIKRLKLQVLHHWQSQQKKLRAAREFYSRGVAARLRNILSQWTGYVTAKRQREEAAERMLQEREERLLQEHWMMWKRHALTSQQMQQVYLTNLANRHLQAWRLYTVRQRSLHLASTACENMTDHHVKSRALQAWQRAYRTNQLARQMQASLRQRQVSAAFTDWKKFARNCRSQRFRQKTLLKWVFDTWKFRCLEQQTTRSLTLRVVHHWRRQVQQSKDLDQSVTAFLSAKDSMKGQQVLAVWRLAWQQQQKAEEHYNNGILTRCVGAWHSYAASSRQRLNALRVLRDKKCKTLISSCFAKWRHDHLHSQDLEKRLAGFCQQRAAETLARVVQAWHHATMEEVAEKRHNTSLLAKAWSHWKQSFGNNQTAAQLAEDKQTRMNRTVFQAILLWSRARKSEKESYYLVEAMCGKHSLQAAFILWKTETGKKRKANGHARNILQRKVFQEWILVVQKSNALQVLSEKAKRSCNRLRLASAAKTWVNHYRRVLLLRNLLDGALLRRNQARLLETFTEWRREARDRRADRHRESALLKRGWARWRERVAERVLEKQFEEDMCELADDHYQQTIRKRMLRLWLIEARVGRLKRKHDTRLAKKYALIWRNGNKMEEMAKALDIYWSIKEAWSAWRKRKIQTLVSKTMKQHQDEQLTEQTFKAWQKHATPGNNGLRRDLLNRRLYAAFRTWRDRMPSGGDDTKSCSSSFSYTSSSGASELAGIWINATRTGSVYADGASASL